MRLPIALGLLVMMYPPLAKVRYDKTREIAADKRLLTVSLLLNWVVGPAVMFALAWIFLPDEPELRTGLIIVGLARCIAMILVWSDLSCADRETTAVLVAINSVFQVVMFGALGWFYLQVLPSWLGLPTVAADFSFWDIGKSVLVFLGMLFAMFWVSARLGRRGEYHKCFLYGIIFVYCFVEPRLLELNMNTFLFLTVPLLTRPSFLRRYLSRRKREKLEAPSAGTSESPTPA